VIVDLVGKGGDTRTVPMPFWVEGAVDQWMAAAKVTAGLGFRAVSRHGTRWGKGISENVIGTSFEGVRSGCHWIMLLRMICAGRAQNSAM